METHELIFSTHTRMDFIAKETHEENGVEVIVDDSDNLWLNKKHIEEGLDHKSYQPLQENTD